MARKTDGEKIDELEKLMAILLDREGATRARVDQLHTEMKELAASVAELKTAVALLQHDVAEMKKQQEEASKKYWSLLPPLVNAVLSGIISALVAYFVANR
jgi:outer membrane murein-binding lipoprotein Lpp